MFAAESLGGLAMLTGGGGGGGGGVNGGGGGGGGNGASVSDGSMRGVKRQLAEGEKKSWLAPWEAWPVHCLDGVNGISRIDVLTPQQAWTYCVEGNKLLEFLCELAACDPERAGVGLSRFGQVFGGVMDHVVNDKGLEMIMKPEVHRVVVAKAQVLLPHAKYLNAEHANRRPGRGSGVSMRQARSEAKEPQRVNEAVKVLYEWSKDQMCPLRQALRVLSAGGAFFSASCYDKILQGLVLHGSLSKEGSCDGCPLVELQAAARGRLCSDAGGAAPGVLVPTPNAF